MFIKALSAFVSNASEMRDRGAVAGEYAVLLALIAVALVGAVGALSGAIQGALNAAAGVINN